ncbi:MAG: D-sedoheptulose 7-phosphate isomerase [Bacteroidales bacterium]
MTESIRKQLQESADLKNKIAADNSFINKIQEAAKACIRSLETGGKILVAGNGGSAADAQHIAAELVNRFGFERPGLPAMALTTDSSIMTSISNDYGFDRIFARQIEALGKNGDILITITTSGRSANILEGIKSAREKGMFNIVLTGSNCNSLEMISDIVISVPSDSTPRIQEVHILAGHILCSEIESSLFRR